MSKRTFASLGGEMDDMRKRKAVLESELRNLSRVVADGLDSASIRAAITEREAELSKITATTLGRKKSSVQEQVAGLRRFVRDGLGDIRQLLTGKHSNTLSVRQELARHIDSITLMPDGDGIRYKGEWKLLGYRDGAEGQS